MSPQPTLDQLAEQAATSLWAGARLPRLQVLELIRDAMLSYADAATQAQRERQAQHEADLKAAAGEVLVPIPEPGTDASKMLRANRLLIAERHTLKQHLAQVTEERDEAQQQVAVLRPSGTYAWKSRAEAAESALTAQREELDRLRREAFEAGFAARPPTKNNWDRVYVTGELRQWDFSPGGSAWDLRDDAWTAYQTCSPTKSAP